MPSLSTLVATAATPSAAASTTRSAALRRGGPVVLVCTSCSQLGDTSLPTGAALTDIAVLYNALTDAGMDVEIVSVAGGPVPLDPASLAPGAPLKAASAALRRFGGDAAAQRELADTRSFVGLVPDALAGAIFVGGRGAAWDLSFNREAAAFAATVHAAGGVVGGVGHGVGALAGLATGRAITAYTNAEEDADGGAALVPALLQSRLVEAGARFQAGAVSGAPHAVRDGRLVSGQNSASAGAVAACVLEALTGGVAGLGAPGAV